MAVDIVKPIGPHSADEQGADGTIPIRYRVHTTNRDDGSSVVLSSSLLPGYGDLLSSWKPGYVNASRFRCVSRNAVSISESPFWFEVECEFKTVFRERSDNELQPLDRRAKVSKSDRDIVIPFIKDEVSQELIQNTAGDPFVPPLTTTIRQTNYTIRFNVSTLAAWMTDEKKYINDGAVSIRGTLWPAKTLLIDSVSFQDEVWQQADEYFAITVNLIGDKRTHVRNVLNDGLYEISRVATDKRRCMIGGEPVQYPVPLDANGKQISAADLAANPTTAPQYLDFEEFPTNTFASLLPSLA
jgi:hypothetical protein